MRQPDEEKRRPSLVTLADGRQVPSDSREWLFECEASYVLSLPLPARRAFLEGVGHDRKRGPAGRKALEDRIRALWSLRKNKK